jgi:hypothetical protein
VTEALARLPERDDVFSLGVIDQQDDAVVFSPGAPNGRLVPFDFLHGEVPWPFKEEFGRDQENAVSKVIHDKFVVVDFNSDNPTVFSGSSNLAAGGEEANGDSLAMIQDGAIANMYAIEALALFDHYHFRKAMQKATKADPLSLWFPGKYPATDPRSKPWWQRYYDQKMIQFRDRCLFAQVPLPAGLEAVKNVDWASIDAEAAKGKKKAGAKTAKTAKSKKSKSKSAKAAKKGGPKKKTKKKAKKETSKKKATRKSKNKAEAKKTKKKSKKAKRR